MGIMTIDLISVGHIKLSRSSLYLVLLSGGLDGIVDNLRTDY